MLTLTNTIVCPILCAPYPWFNASASVQVETDHSGISPGIPHILRVVCTMRPFLLLSADI